MTIEFVYVWQDIHLHFRLIKILLASIGALRVESGRHNTTIHFFLRFPHSTISCCDLELHSEAGLLNNRTDG
jgi:hypothetical protein